MVPANIIKDPAGLTLIDWQCPTIGDAAEDLATFLSPAMQSLDGGQPLSENKQARFLDAYGNADADDLYGALKALFHWRMAVHCMWKAERGSLGNAEAMQLELAELE